MDRPPPDPSKLLADWMEWEKGETPPGKVISNLKTHGMRDLLDPKSRRDVQSFLERLREREGTTILLTTHDMAEAERLCARIGFLAHGKLVAEGTARELMRRAGATNLDDAFIALTGEELIDEELAAVGD